MIAPRVYVDWENDGVWTGDEISAYVKTASWKAGIWDRLENVARVGQCSVVLDNSDRRFSPDNAAGPYYGKFKPGLPIKITATDGATEWPVFRGVVIGFQADAGDKGRREARVTGEDFIGVLSRRALSLPLRQSITPDAALKLITSAAFRSGRATGRVTLDGNPLEADTLTIGGVTYAFTNGALQSNHWVQIGSTPTYTAMNLAACINAAQTHTRQGYEADVVYGDNGATVKHPDVTASAEQLGDNAGGTTTIAPTGGLVDAYTGKLIGGAFRREAQQFWVASGVLTEIKIRMGSTKYGTPGDLRWSVCAQAGGMPGAVLQTGTFTPTLNAVNTIAVGDGITLLDGIPYWLTLELATVPTDPAYYGWHMGEDCYTGIRATRDNDAAWSPHTSRDHFLDVTTVAYAGARVNLTAVMHGAWGNSVPLVTDSLNITLSGATLAGGVDGPDGFIDFDAGTITLTETGAKWNEDKTSALKAVRDVVESEGAAVFFGAKDGTLNYHNRHWEVRQQGKAAAVALDGEFQGGAVAISLDDIINRVTVRYTPEVTRVTGVVAKADNVLEVPGTSLRRSASGVIERYNPTDDLPDTVNTAFVRLSFVDLETGEVQAAENLRLPLVPGTDFTLSDLEDMSGYNYTSEGYVRFDVAATGTDVEITMENTALGQLYVSGLQVRGTMKIGYDPVDVMAEDATSVEMFGVHPVTIELPLMFTGVDQFAPQLATYALARSANPESHQDAIAFENITEVGGVNLFSLDIGDVVQVSEPQTAISGRRAWITGISGSIAPGNLARLQWTLRRLDNMNYLILDDTTYGRLDVNRLAL